MSSKLLNVQTFFKRDWFLWVRAHFPNTQRDNRFKRKSAQLYAHTHALTPHSASGQHRWMSTKEKNTQRVFRILRTKCSSIYYIAIFSTFNRRWSLTTNNDDNVSSYKRCGITKCELIWKHYLPAAAADMYVLLYFCTI